jgi:hypothetical protein
MRGVEAVETAHPGEGTKLFDPGPIRGSRS